MVKRPKLPNAGEDNEFDPASELDASFVSEGNSEGNDSDQDIADQEAAGVAPAPTRPTAHAQAQGNGSNNPRTVSPKAQFNKLKGEFVFHHHDHEDELFLVVKGRFRMEFRDHHEWIEAGEFIVVPRGVEHKPVADEECWILLFEPASTLNTGNVVNDRTLRELERV